MTDTQFSYSEAKARLDEIVAEVRKKDLSLEKSLDLLEEGVGLANKCTELIDEADWAAAEQSEASDEPSDAADQADPAADAQAEDSESAAK